VLALLLAAGIVTSRKADWQPPSLFVALAVTMVVADVMSVSARRVRMSAGLGVQVVGMALMGPAPAAAMGVLSTISDVLNRVRPLNALNNMAIFGFLGLVGGLLFDGLGSLTGLDPYDNAYALLLVPLGYFLLAGLNLFLVVFTGPELAGTNRLRILRESGLPPLPIELLNALLAATAVLVWAHAGLAAAAALLLVLVITVPLLHVVGTALKSGDDLLALRHVSDERAAEVARLASDRERLLSEVLDAEERERTRLAESLHDGPMQRLVALKQDAGEAGAEAMAERLGTAIAETRAIISAFHPATVRELGFEASLRAAISPFPAARSVELTIETALDDRRLAATLLLPVAQELVVNAVKHASPRTIDMSVRAHDGDVVLEVADDGVGIDTSDAGRKVQAGHLGLAMVRRRVEDAGGRFEIETRADGGTHSRVILPRALL
jgi:two-component system NarL family sensor kinase